MTKKLLTPNQLAENLGVKPFHPAAIQNEWQRVKIYQIGTPGAIQASPPVTTQQHAGPKPSRPRSGHYQLRFLGYDTRSHL